MGGVGCGGDEGKGYGAIRRVGFAPGPGNLLLGGGFNEVRFFTLR